MNHLFSPLAVRGATLAALLTFAVGGSLWAQPLTPGNAGVDVVPRSGVIDSPGHYVLNRDLTLSANSPGPGLTIRSHDVTVDLNGRSIVGAGQMVGVGILIDGVRGVAVRNGKVADRGHTMAACRGHPRDLPYQIC